MTSEQTPLGYALEVLEKELIAADIVDIGEWQSIKTESPLQATRELVDVIIRYEVPKGIQGLLIDCQPSWPWAEDHFLERVGGEPLNPGVQYQNWPWYGGLKGKMQTIGEKFSHTYMERIWPKFANVGETRPNGRQVFVPHNGIRYEYGDLSDLVALLQRSPLTRQAYLPIWFPEDTGVVHGERVPCSIGYHFMVRDGRMSCRYLLRSCDYYRHLRDDLYMAGRLMQWICDQLEGVQPGTLTTLIGSLHIFEGDVWKLEKDLNSA